MIIVLIIAAFVIFAGFSIASSHARKQALSESAAQRGWTFHEGNDRRFDDRFPLNALERGSSRYAYNRSSGREEGFLVHAFDYHYETSSGTGSDRKETSHYFSGILIEASGLGLQPLAIRPEGFFDRLVSNFGFNDIDFESEEFSRAFHVSGPDKRFAYEVLTQPVMSRLLNHQDLSFEFHPTGLLVFDGRTWDPPRFDEVMRVALELAGNQRPREGS